MQQAGMLDPAAERLYEVLRHAPGQLGVMQFLGGVEVLRGRLDDAVRLLTEVVRRKPHAAEAHNNLGLALVSLGRASEAVAHYEAAVAVDPAYAAALNNLGNALAGLERHEEAVARFRAALAIRPDFALAKSNLGAALAALGRHEEAIAEQREALALDRDNASLHENLATTLQAAGRTEEALAHLSAVRQSRPNMAVAHSRLGAALQELGRIEEARKFFEQAIALEPRRPSHYLNLTGNMRMRPGDAAIQAMEALARDEASLPAVERPTIHFALGKALGDIGQHERAFGHLQRGNALKRQQIEYDEERALRRLSQVREVVTGELIQAKKGAGDPSRQPIFILGMPRSGSSLIEQILASHPKVRAAGEVTAFRDAMRELGFEEGDPDYPDSVPPASRSDLQRLGAAYLARMEAIAARGEGFKRGELIERVTDKLPSNFRNAGLIHLALPNARIIHTCRNPIDTCLSCFAIEFVQQPFTYDLGELGRYWRAYAELMDHWRKALPPGIMLDVHYEAVVDDLEGEARRIVAHCGLEWDDRCLDFQSAPRPVRTASLVQVRQPIYRSSVGRWRPDAATLRPLLEGLDLEDG